MEHRIDSTNRLERLERSERPERSERSEHRKKSESPENEPRKKSGLLNVLMVQTVLCIVVATALLFGNLIAGDSVAVLKAYYRDNIQSNNDMEDDFRSIGEQVWSFLQQSGGEQNSSSSESENDSSQGDSSTNSGDSSSQSSDSSQSDPNSDSTSTGNSTSDSISDSASANATSQDTGDDADTTPKKTAGTTLVSAKLSLPVNHALIQDSETTEEPVWQQTETNFSIAELSESEQETEEVPAPDLVVPLTGEITSGYGYRLHPFTGLLDFHKGVDIGADEGTPFSVAMAGTVLTVGSSVTFGNYIVVEHADGLVTRYGHCLQTLVEEGQLVQAGDVVGAVGSTGQATGPHLHFDVSRDGVYFDPYQLIDSFAP